MVTNGACASQRRMLSSALASILGELDCHRVDLLLQKLTIYAVFNYHRYGGYSSAGWGHGVRNIVFSSPNPGDGLDTWIRLEYGETRARVTLDKNYN